MRQRFVTALQKVRSTERGKLESSSTKIVQCPGPVKFSSFQPPERVFCVFRETGFQFSSCDRFSFLRKSSAVTYSFVHLGWIAFLLVLLCERKREKACFAPFLCSCVLQCRFFSNLNASFVGFCCDSEQPRASLFICALGLQGFTTRSRLSGPTMMTRL